MIFCKAEFEMFVNLRCITTSDIEVLSDWKGGLASRLVVLNSEHAGSLVFV